MKYILFALIFASPLEMEEGKVLRITEFDDRASCIAAGAMLREYARGVAAGAGLSKVTLSACVPVRRNGWRRRK